jgi:hypothetical protein
MLVYLATQAHCHTMQEFLDSWGQALKPVMQVVSYEYAHTVKYSEVLTVIFADYDRLPAAQRAGFGALCDTISARGIRVLNHPQHSARRSQLLSLLKRQGSNEFSAYPVAEAERAKFPVFLRFTNDHNGPQSPLLHNAEELQQAIDIGVNKGVAREDMLVVEFLSTMGSDGMYYTYSAFCIEGEVVPRQCLASAALWDLREPEWIVPEALDKEKEYLESNPHQQMIRDAFKLAKIDYGRIDYSLLKNKPQVWEINPHPVVLGGFDKYQRAQIPNQKWFADRIVPLFGKLATQRKP